ncbi:MAG: CCA tRNA nucleotidyltransferase [Nitrospirae bacterium]|nr:CCA tRNA nucleotidyltransferase [Nitrospirota bacterium]
MHTLLKLFICFAEEHGLTDNAFVVGGAVRDILLGNDMKDIDIAVKGDSLNIAKKFAEETGGSFVLLDAEFQTARVIKNGCFLDISVMRGDSILDDLSERDITINAMAIPLSLQPSALSPQSLSLIDPYGGRDDLSNKTVRMVSEENLIKDPLRILRIYRFSAELNFFIEIDTLDASGRLSPLISSVAVERIAEELRHILRLDDSYDVIKTMSNKGILRHVFPEFKEDFSVLNLELYKNVEDILNNYPHFMLPESKKICLKLSVFFTDADTAKNASIRLKMSRKEVEFIYKTASNRRRILRQYEEYDGHFDEIASVRLLKEFRDDIYPLIILSIAQAPEIADFCKKLLAFYNEPFKARMGILPVITGDELIKNFDLKPSPLFKKILAAIEDAVLEGKIRSKEEALQIVKEMLTTG